LVAQKHPEQKKKKLHAVDRKTGWEIKKASGKRKTTERLGENSVSARGGEGWGGVQGPIAYIPTQENRDHRVR